MPESKHTPGPWEVRRRNSGASEIIAKGHNIARTGPWGAEEANAHLIAAAPAMFEALEKRERARDLERQLVHLAGRGGHATLDPRTVTRAERDADLAERAALAQARGEES